MGADGHWFGRHFADDGGGLVADATTAHGDVFVGVLAGGNCGVAADGFLETVALECGGVFTVYCDGVFWRLFLWRVVVEFDGPRRCLATKNLDKLSSS